MVLGLRGLRLAGNDITDDGVRAIAASPYFARLKTLDVTFNPLADPGGRALLDSTRLKSLTRLLYPSIGMGLRLRLALERRYHT